MKRTILPFLIGLLSISAAADSLVAIEILLPTSEVKIVQACDRAYQELVNDRIAVEAREGLSCLLETPRGSMDEVENGFKRNCVSALEGQASERREGWIQLDAGSLKGNFDFFYGAKFRASCLDRAVQKFQASEGGSSSSSAVREGCYALSSCN